MLRQITFTTRILNTIGAFVAAAAVAFLFSQTLNAGIAVLFGPRTIAFLEESKTTGREVEAEITYCRVALLGDRYPKPQLAYYAGYTGVEMEFKNRKFVRTYRPQTAHFSPSHRRVQLEVLKAHQPERGLGLGLGQPRVTADFFARVCKGEQDNIVWKPDTRRVVKVKFLEPQRHPIVVDDVAAMLKETRAYLLYAWAILILDALLIAAALVWRLRRTVTHPQRLAS
jgi:hypothetical protein